MRGANNKSTGASRTRVTTTAALLSAALTFALASPVSAVETPTPSATPTSVTSAPSTPVPTPSSTNIADDVVTPNIIGGTDATIADAPWQVALIDPTASSEFQGQFCGGSIIAAQWIATAAHCVVSGSSVSTASSIRILAGQATLSDNSATSRSVAVSNIYVHPLYVSSAEHDDIALLKLSAPLTLVAGSVQAIGIPTSAPAAGNSELISGWGNQSRVNNNFPHIMQKANVTVVADSTCVGLYAGYDNAKMVCAGTPSFDKDTCQGDSGGPMARLNGTWVLEGITSYGAGCAESPYPGVYTEVYNYRSWIASYLTSSFVTTPTPTISGSAISGQTLSATTGTWSPVPDSYSYRWTVGGTNVAGSAGAGATYVVQAADAGKTVRVKVTANKSGYSSTTKTSAATATVTLPFVTAPVPTIGGTKVVGRTLTAREGTWSPVPTSYTYRWLSAATKTGTYTPISGATSRTYLLKSSDRTRFIKVEVTAVKSGYASTKSTSNATVAIG